MTEKTVSDIYDLLKSELPDLKAAIVALRLEMKEVKEVSKQNNRALRGSNSNPGLVADTSSLCKSQKKMTGRIEKIEVCLHEGIDHTPGLVHQVRDLNKWRKELRYWYVAFVGAIVIGVINITLQLISQNLINLP